MRLRGAGRIAHRVGDPVVDCVEPGRVQIVEPRDLDGRGLPSEHAETVVPGVPGDVDQDVDAVVANPLCDGGVGSALHHARGDGTEPVERRLRLRIVEIGEHLESRAIVRAEHRLDERGQRRMAIGRDIADAQASVGVGRVGGRHVARLPVPLEPSGERPMQARRSPRACDGTTPSSPRADWTTRDGNAGAARRAAS